MLFRREDAPDAVDLPIFGTARVDRRTKDLVKRLVPGEIAVIDHADIDRVAAETLVESGVVAVVNAAASVTGRYPNLGPLLIVNAGIALLDGVGSKVMELVDDGAEVTILGNDLVVDGATCASGERQDADSIEVSLDVARQRVNRELEKFAANTLEYLRKEKHLLVDDLDLPDVPVEFQNRHVLVVVRGLDYKDDLRVLQRSGYLAEMQPLLVGVDGGADALLEMGRKPDVVIGDMDSVSEEALRCGAALVVHAYRDGTAPGAQRLDDLGLRYQLLVATGTSEDVAMLLAENKGAELIVAVGTHNSMVEFLDKGRAGMASTFLVRMKVGPILVDAKGVSRLYQHRVRKRDLTMLVVAAFIALLVIVLVSEPLRLFVRGFLLQFK
jgi:uncharacterized membrane-anchored protein